MPLKNLKVRFFFLKNVKPDIRKDYLWNLQMISWSQTQMWQNLRKKKRLTWKGWLAQITQKRLIVSMISSKNHNFLRQIKIYAWSILQRNLNIQPRRTNSLEAVFIHL